MHPSKTSYNALFLEKQMDRPDLWERMANHLIRIGYLHGETLNISIRYLDQASISQLPAHKQDSAYPNPRTAEFTRWPLWPLLVKHAQCGRQMPCQHFWFLLGLSQLYAPSLRRRGLPPPGSASTSSAEGAAISRKHFHLARKISARTP